MWSVHFKTSCSTSSCAKLKPSASSRVNACVDPLSISLLISGGSILYLARTLSFLALISTYFDGQLVKQALILLIFFKRLPTAYTDQLRFAQGMRSNKTSANKKYKNCEMENKTERRNSLPQQLANSEAERRMFALRPSFFHMKSLACHNIVTDEASVLDKTTFTRPPPECERDKKYIHWPKDADAQTHTWRDPS